MIPYVQRAPLVESIALVGFSIAILAGCGGTREGAAVPDLIIGRFGEAKEEFNKPRAIAIDKQDRLFVVDMTARIQVFDRDGKFLKTWKTPASENGRPTGLSIDRDGSLLVADTHYFRVLPYNSEGVLQEDRIIGGVCGHGPGEFHFVTDVVQDSLGNYFVGEYGEFDRIQKFDRDRNFVYQFGSHGEEPGQFRRPQSLAMDSSDCLWVADANNHRIQQFDVRGETPKLLQVWGVEGEEIGQLRYPFGIQLGADDTIYVCEFGNGRVQQFTRSGKYLAHWGTQGRGPGKFSQPWSCAMDSQGHLFVLDSYNHRIQRFPLGTSAARMTVAQAQ